MTSPATPLSTYCLEFPNQRQTAASHSDAEAWHAIPNPAGGHLSLAANWALLEVFL